MAGFKVPQKRYKLIFEDPDMWGAEVVMRSSSIAQALELQCATEQAETNLDRTAALMKLTAAALVEWNLEEDDGTPIPATYEGLAAQEGHFFWAVFNEWVRAVSGVPAPLDDGSTSGDQSLEASMPMEALSSSPSS